MNQQHDKPKPGNRYHRRQTRERDLGERPCTMEDRLQAPQPGSADSIAVYLQTDVCRVLSVLVRSERPAASFEHNGEAGVLRAARDFSVASIPSMPSVRSTSKRMRSMGPGSVLTAATVLSPVWAVTTLNLKR